MCKTWWKSGYFLKKLLYFSTRWCILYPINWRNVGVLSVKELYFSSLYRENFRFADIAAFEQTWSDGDGHRFLDVPRSSHGLLYVGCAQAEIVFPNSEMLVAEKGDVVLLPKGARYTLTFRGSTPETYTDILVHFTLLGASGRQLKLQDEVQVLAATDDMRALFEQMQDLYKNRVYPAVQLKSTLYALLAQLTDAAQTALAAMEDALLYIENHLHEKLQVSDLAKRASMSETAFRVAFRAAVGDAPNQYILHLRLEKAKEMLANETVSLADVAAALTFYDSAFFCKIFKKYIGITPTQYRQQLAAGIRAVDVRAFDADMDMDMDMDTDTRTTKADFDTVDEMEEPATFPAPTPAFTRLNEELPTALL